MERADFVQSHVQGTREYAAVLAVADALYRHLEEPDVVSAIALANLPGRSSSEVQSVLLNHARSLGFRDESRGLFAGYLTSALRPDYFLEIEDTGVLVEVERRPVAIFLMTCTRA